MLQLKDKEEKYSFLRKINSENILLLVLNENIEVKKNLEVIRKYFRKYPLGEVIIISKISLLKPKLSFDSNKKLEAVEKLCSIFSKRGKKINTVRIGSVFEEDDFLKKALKKIQLGKIVYYEGGFKYHYLISKQDIVEAINKISTNTISGEIFNITLNKLKQEEIINRLKEKYNFDSKEKNFVADSTTERLFDTSNNKIIKFKPNITLKKFLSGVNLPKVEKKTYSKKNITKINTRPKRNITKHKIILATIKSASVILFLIIAFIGVDFSLDNYYLYTNIKNKNIGKALYFANKLRNKILPTAYGKNYSNVYNTIFYGLNAVDIAKESIEKNTVDINTIESIQEMSTKSLEFANEVDSTYFLTNKEKQIYNNYKSFFNLNKEASEYINLLKIYPFFKNSRNTLILIQNSNELRPTGGFIGSYALVQTENYKIKDYKFDDIYNIDGTLKEKYANLLHSTPLEYKDYLNTNYLYSRDINLLLNSKERDETVIKYFESTLNTKIDAIAYVNLNTLKNVLDITGPIFLAAYDTEVNSDNFDTLAQINSEKNYYEGSTQKKNFLSLLGSKVIQNITTNKGLLNSKSIEATINALQSKDMVFYFKDSKYQKIVEGLDLNGQIQKLDGYDYLYILENNLGENKVNKKTDKKVDYLINYDQRRGIKETNIKITLNNNSDSYSWPYGEYKGILQVLVPEDIDLTQVQFVNEEKQNIDILRNVNVQQFTNSISLLEIPFSVKPTKSIYVTVTYEQQDNNFATKSYSLYIQKQPGTIEYPLRVELNIPDVRKVRKELKIDKNTKISL
ncbi:hypothetical protein COV24_02420 [candidate division WWE3 bacterium CG10_big_fil_rev_8_21_14_0_10_32_10]|uniref:DUF4012 domain-containing protein n=1 Tax=candidate division WWE3 bacterium CG10_big_fil_rev_8_21_14_0_10_32_10 TaxID=1975090 RepID=A0A2H0RAH3_UNCKA|nr:MAG: hypothetical protein COV24_02420 [candidate division WWE3 bacterium CG10_big_fil_rev_8_21_14_0_10_32_10]